ncbi:damage-inducible protein [Phenylobacterium hankyongense]|uniref:Damage-inducible protein n=1 Tax=Phenylobacterium hankyongense TaxID=1813876 RepID=A0A328AWA2_9CAUL|nr:CinA family protein [Phenylobacterium hankyongense]RAK58525.1 damage-inducible protein [Phenylobacterium hankyongense]
MEELEALAQTLGERLKARSETVAVAESSSGGLISAALLSVSGASKYYLGGAVVYTPKARVLLMDIPRAALVDGMRSASEPYALLLARTARERFGATWGLSETGAAGPTGNGYGDAAGHTCIAVAGPLEMALTIETGSEDRSANMRAFAAAALEMLGRATAD